MIQVRDSGGLAAIGAIRMRDAGNVLVDIRQLYARDADGLSAFFSTLKAELSATFASGYGHSSVPVVVSTNSVACTPAGGRAPFTYAWSTAEPGWSAITPSAALTAFRSAALSPGEYASADFICTVTDASGAVAVSPPVSVSAGNTFGPPL